MEVQKWIDKGIDFTSDFGLKIISVIIIWIIGSWVIKKLMTKKNYNESLQKFLLNLIG